MPVKTPVRQKILVVDDNSNILDYLKLLLGKYGFEPLPATNGHEALEQLANFGEDDGPVMAIVDIVLGSENGVQLAHALVRKLPKLQILLISGYADTAVFGGLLPNGRAAAFLTKNFTAEELKAAIDSLLP